MLALLGQTGETDKQYRECQEAIESLKEKIRQKFAQKDGENILQDYEAKEKQISPQVKADRSVRFQQRKKLPGHFGKIYALHWGANSTDIVSASQDGKLLVWNAQTTNKKIAIPLRSAWVMTCAYSPQGTFVASGGLDNLCSVFNIADSVGWEVKQPHRELQQHEGYLSCCRFVDENRILTASGDASCILWDIEKQSPESTFLGHTGDVESVSVNKKSNTFVSGAIDATAKVWDLRQGTNQKLVSSFKGHSSDINSVEWFPDGQSFISGSDDSSCRLFDLRSHRELNKFATENIFGSITSVDCSSSGGFIFAGYDEEPYCLAWNTITAQWYFSLEHPTRCSCLQVSPDGYGLATGCWDKVLRVWA